MYGEGVPSVFVNAYRSLREGRYLWGITLRLNLSRDLDETKIVIHYISRRGA